MLYIYPTAYDTLINSSYIKISALIHRMDRSEKSGTSAPMKRENEGQAKQAQGAGLA